MERKTKVHAEDGRQQMEITREFDLPVALLFKAYTEPELVEQWMSNPYTTAKMLKFDCRKHGSYQMQSTDPQGKVLFGAGGVIHEVIADKKITRTFEMDGTPYGVQLEIYEFESVTDSTSKLKMHVIYESVNQRDQVLKLPFAQGISMAHDRIEEILKNFQVKS